MFSPTLASNTVEISGTEISDSNRKFLCENISLLFPKSTGQKLASVKSFEVCVILGKFSQFLTIFESEIAISVILQFWAEIGTKTPNFILHEILNEMRYKTFEDGVGKLTRQIFEKFYFCCRQKFLGWKFLQCG